MSETSKSVLKRLAVQHCMHFDDGRGPICGTSIGHQITRASKDVCDTTCQKCIKKLREQFFALKEFLEMVKQI